MNSASFEELKDSSIALTCPAQGSPIPGFRWAEVFFFVRSHTILPLTDKLIKTERIVIYYANLEAQHMAPHPRLQVDFSKVHYDT